MYKIQHADGTFARNRYETEGAAITALKQRNEIGSAVVWFNDAGVSKLWLAHCTEAGLTTMRDTGLIKEG